MCGMNAALARAISIVGHPVVVISVATLLTAWQHGTSAGELRQIGAALALLNAVMIGYTWHQVRAGRWVHVDASVRSERKSLNAFLAALLVSSAVLLWLLQ